MQVGKTDIIIAKCLYVSIVGSVIWTGQFSSGSASLPVYFGLECYIYLFRFDEALNLISVITILS